MSLFQDWQEAHKDDPSPLPERIRKMREFYGKASEGVTCKRCKFLKRYSQGTRWLKCSKSRVSKSTATDWRAGWPACGMYQEEKPE